MENILRQSLKQNDFSPSSQKMSHSLLVKNVNDTRPFKLI